MTILEAEEQDTINLLSFKRIAKPHIAWLITSSEIKVDDEPDLYFQDLKSNFKDLFCSQYTTIESLMKKVHLDETLILIVTRDFCREIIKRMQFVKVKLHLIILPMTSVKI